MPTPTRGAVSARGPNGEKKGRIVGGAIGAVLAATLGGAVLRDTQGAPAHERAPEAEPASDVE